MKKLAIAGASVALAAMPVLGVFAVDQTSITDTVTVNINPSCSIGSTDSAQGAGNNFSETMANGETKTWAAGTDGGTIKVSCNNSAGWHIKAVGAGEGTPVTSMKPNTVAAANAIPTGTSGDASYWAFQVTGTNTVTTYNSFSAIPATATKVAGASTTVSEGTINTGYKVRISDTQLADTYVGKVTYTVATGTGD